MVDIGFRFFATGVPMVDIGFRVLGNSSGVLMGMAIPKQSQVCFCMNETISPLFVLKARTSGCRAIFEPINFQCTGNKNESALSTRCRIVVTQAKDFCHFAKVVFGKVAVRAASFHRGLLGRHERHVPWHPSRFPKPGCRAHAQVSIFGSFWRLRNIHLFEL